MGTIIGRKKEIKELQRLYDSPRSEFLAIYGRRRVGKTYLIKEMFQQKFAFYHTGLAPVSETEDTDVTFDMKDQLKHFHRSLKRYGCTTKTYPKNWLDAFYMLEDLLEQNDTGEKQIIFIDELPWMDTAKSNIIRAIEAFWNGWCNGRNILLIVCGSAASWMLDNVIEDHGGLYDRLTYEIKLSPFTLAETEEYINMLGGNMSRYDVTQAYMAVGGIPFYLNFWQTDMSVPQNIDQLMFANNGRLKGEFTKLFHSLFTSPEQYIRIVRFLATRHRGYTRNEIIKHLGTEGGGTITKVLKSLIASDFILCYQPFGSSKREKLYKLVDPYCWFYLKFISDRHITDQQYWQNNYLSQVTSVWRGLAFEELCFVHIPAIKSALQIGGVVTSESAWSQQGSDSLEGSQIDMIISRGDNIVNLCEIKFYNDDYVVDKDEERLLLRRIESLKTHIKKTQTIHLTLITTFGLKRTQQSGLFKQVLTLDDLFK